MSDLGDVFEHPTLCHVLALSYVIGHLNPMRWRVYEERGYPPAAKVPALMDLWCESRGRRWRSPMPEKPIESIDHRATNAEREALMAVIRMVQPLPAAAQFRIVSTAMVFFGAADEPGDRADA